MNESTQRALLLVDIQNDFCLGGAMEVPNSNQIFGTVNAWIERTESEGWLVIASRDWHTVDHISFTERGGPWPEHCVQDTPGAEFHAEMQLPRHAVRVSKGTAFDRDAYSAFDGTDLANFLRRQHVRQLYVAGLALDVCVRATVLAALDHGFAVDLLSDGTRGVEADRSPEVLAELEQAGARLY